MYKTILCGEKNNFKESNIRLGKIIHRDALSPSFLCVCVVKTKVRIYNSSWTKATPYPNVVAFKNQIICLNLHSNGYIGNAMIEISCLKHG